MPAANRLYTMPVLPHHRSKLRVPTEISLLGKGRAQSASGTCSHCHRTPLVGECVHVYSSPKRGEELVCELCRPLRTAQPDRTVRVRSAEAVPLVRVGGPRTSTRP